MFAEEVSAHECAVERREVHKRFNRNPKALSSGGVSPL